MASLDLRSSKLRCASHIPQSRQEGLGVARTAGLAGVAVCVHVCVLCMCVHERVLFWRSYTPQFCNSVSMTLRPWAKTLGEANGKVRFGKLSRHSYRSTGQGVVVPCMDFCGTLVDHGLGVDATR